MHPIPFTRLARRLAATALVLTALAPVAEAAATCTSPIRISDASDDASAFRRLQPLCRSVRPRADRSEAQSPLIEGPISSARGPFLLSTLFNLEALGYEQAEYFISGTADAYARVGTFDPNGRWRATPGATAPYKTRIFVYRPTDPRKFNGTVIVEWLNVSSGLDTGPDWISAHTELMREGYAWVGVSAQFVGVEGGREVLGGLGSGLKKIDPVRYGSLSHPGDSFSYDIFTQAGRAVRNPDRSGPDPLDGLEPEWVIAAGESQSAFRLVTYINAVDPIARLYDGFLVHSRGGGAAPLSQDPLPAVETPEPARIRSDVRVPVLTFQTESDLLLLGFATDRQPDSSHFRLWEVAGTAHADTYTVFVGNADAGGDPEVAKLAITSSPIPGIIDCGKPINSGPQHFVLKAAFAALDRWVRTGVAPPRSPLIELVENAAGELEIARDANGIAIGGIRTPYVDVPTATLSGEGQTGSNFCFLMGTTAPFDAAKLAALYPDQESYVAAVTRSTDRAVRSGFIRKPDGELIKAAARTTDLGR